MGIANDYVDKAKAKVKQAKGSVNQSQGKGVKGGLQKLMGKVEEAEADMRLKADKQAAKNDVRDDDTVDDFAA